MRKGIELPINILVVVAIAVIVLLGMIALYFIGIGPFSNATALNAAKNNGCRTYIDQYPTSCNDTTFAFSYSGNTSITAFNEFMNQYYGCSEDGCIRRQCNCVAS